MHDQQYIHKKAKQAGADPELLTQEYDLFDQIEQAKFDGDIQLIDKLTRQLIEVQLKQPRNKWLVKTKYSTSF